MSNLTYVRWRKGDSRRMREFPALTSEHPSYTTPCLLCGYSLGSDTGGVQLLAVGPDDDENRTKHEQGRWYSAAALIVHTSCLADLDDAHIETLVADLRLEFTSDRTGPPTPP